MPRFFVDSVSGDKISIRGNDAYHIGRSLRMRLGDVITVCADRVEYRAKILSISDKEVVCDVLSAEESANEPTVNVVLYQALPKSDKMDLIVQKAVELGVYKIVPVITARCVSRPAKSGYEKRVERYNKIALEAAKQSGRGYVPEVTNFISFDECIAELKECDESFMCYEKGGVSLSKTGISDAAEGVKTIGLFIGCEGGFETHEAESCGLAGVTVVSLGPRILRCETAPLAALSVIMSLTGNM
ncbi:16S rRNA (uracil(1498)-N(3))-methyltransferase [uncultured Ruminococcus sp.]|uniref:16S rRNA (uracil(1498)-N(3))-methyltransferase n=1 Tax=uncultured Ruminococcus sp. TaxID=165186 RepID=UPI00260E06F3|nr:16S rRNA (uracil(1498)-N(3))-methyltransferase [uncultured Ruminococcus sp.]